MALSILRDFHRQADWNIATDQPMSATGSGSSKSDDQSRTSNSPINVPVNHDVIRQRRQYTVTEKATDKWSRWSLAQWRRPHSLFSTEPQIIHR